MARPESRWAFCNPTWVGETCSNPTWVGETCFSTCGAIARRDCLRTSLCSALRASYGRPDLLSCKSVERRRSHRFPQTTHKAKSPLPGAFCFMARPERWTRAFHGARGCAPPDKLAYKSASCAFVELQSSRLSRTPQTTKPPCGGLVVCGPPGEIRTPDTQVRSLVLYPAELRAEERQVRETSPLGQVQVGIIW